MTQPPELARTQQEKSEKSLYLILVFVFIMLSALLALILIDYIKISNNLYDSKDFRESQKIVIENEQRIIQLNLKQMQEESSISSELSLVITKIKNNNLINHANLIHKVRQ